MVNPEPLRRPAAPEREPRLAPDETMTIEGGRQVRLYLPFSHGGKKITKITIGPSKLDHTMKWNAGQYASSIQLLCEMAGESEELIRQLRYPDAERVMAAFMANLPDVIRDHITSGTIPQTATEPASQTEQDFGDADEGHGFGDVGAG